MKMDTQILHGVLRAFDVAQMTNTWVILVCANDEITAACRKTLASILPESAKFSGRTASLEGGGKVSVAPVQDEPFPDAEDQFSVEFIGWWQTKIDAGMQRWLQRVGKAHM